MPIDENQNEREGDESAGPGGVTDLNSSWSGQFRGELVKETIVPHSRGESILPNYPKVSALFPP